jgi:hypothetical protein
MKTIKGSLLIMLGLFVVACSDDENSTKKLSSEEQAEMVASSIGKSGFAGASDQSADYTDDAVGSSGGRVAACGYTAKNTVSLSGTFGQIIFSFDYAYDVALVCNGSEEPTKFNSDFTYEGNFDGPRFASDYSGSGSLVITSLEAASANYTLNGTYDRAGSFESKIEEHSSGSSNIVLHADDVMINKSTKVIMSGSADASVSGVVSGKGNYSFDAHIVFNGDGTANIKVNGEWFIMNLSTGQVSAEIHS